MDENSADEPKSTSESEKRSHYVLGPRMWAWQGDTVTLKLSLEAQNYLTKAMNLADHADVDDIFRKALVLYTHALQAHKEGLSVGTSRSPENLETVFVGF